MMDRYASAAGLRRRLIIPVPILTPRLSSHWVNLVTPLPYALARPLVDSLINDVVVHPDRDINRLIDHTPVTLDRAIERALAVVGDLRLTTSWMDSARSNTAALPLAQDPDWSGGTIYENTQEVTTTASPSAPVRHRRGYRRGARLVRGQCLVDHSRGPRQTDWAALGCAEVDATPTSYGSVMPSTSFRVEAHERPKLLRLRAEMKVPGGAWLEWRITTDETGATHLRPAGPLPPARRCWSGVLVGSPTHPQGDLETTCRTFGRRCRAGIDQLTSPPNSGARSAI